MRDILIILVLLSIFSSAYAQIDISKDIATSKASDGIWTLDWRFDHKLFALGGDDNHTLELRIIGRLVKSHGELDFGHLGHLKIQITPYEIQILDK
jgi:hypothetical protein